MNRLVITIAVFSVYACSSANYPPLDVVKSVNISRYLGKWYEIARLPNSFQEDCYCATAEYKLIDSLTLSVRNECREDSISGETDYAEGEAFVVEGSNNAKLKVQFFWPFKGDYWIIELDETNYSYAVVGTPSRKYLWILAREPKMQKEMYDALIDRIAKKGFDVDNLIISDQLCFEGD
ncbi:MAG: lipocalin family protein [Melioribacteraceae bacterium]|nr:lipocalin family protein [Melioribacteraceae bacterium]